MTRHLATLRESYQIPLVRTSSKLVVKRTPDGRSLPRTSTTQGCSPWRPAAVMSTTWRKNYSFKWIFKGRQERTGPHKSAGLYQPLNPSSGQTDFRDRLTRVQLLFTRNLFPLQSSKFSFEYLLLPPRSALEAVQPGVTPKASSRASTPAYSLGYRSHPSGGVWVARLSAIHFQG
ncbi:hypothetical protein BU16DRAFT_575972 [Lophium mytilinum]|uniref:Uncharacterized protein n=1 Tax=Lophium mytilinum TaxID=390894 RepID=A0A6A6QB80_9PEZI|nr:hypothetical protein BU16DRAFT_575972 [Lophium mytilinum]